MSTASDETALLREALEELLAGFRDLPRVAPDRELSGVREVLLEAARRLHDNYPYSHPLYAGQMLKPPHPVARLAYALAMWLNPNNHALDGGRASSAMEKESVAAIGAMFGWNGPLGHLTSGGTMANLEALWVAGRLSPGAAVLGSEQAHYTHSRMCDVLGLPFETVPADRFGRMDAGALQARLEQGPVGTVVATAGTTALGAVDPLGELFRLRERHGFRLHVDAAYGGYHGLAGNLGEETSRELARIGEADSIVIDPHKHGLQPYGCGCVLFRDPSVGRFYKHDSPYTYFSSAELHLGEISLECSRAGASAVALWATQRLFPMIRGGEMARRLEQGREAALGLHRFLAEHPAYLTALPPELDIVVFAPAAAKATEISRRSRRLFEVAAGRDLHLALAQVSSSLLAHWWPGVDLDAAAVTLLRSCLMKPEHLDWLPRIQEILDDIHGE